jgi:glyoxylase-like metal-dependent hydrolase (beta-lactamase superfamily II)
MVNINKKHEKNVEGEFFVDTSCINCDTYRQITTNIFSNSGNYSAVYKQPSNFEEEFSSLQAIVACPTGSIGSISKLPVKQAINGFPIQMEKKVYYLGFNSPKSFGANSYFIKHPKGNWMIDSPKFLPLLVKWINKMGGIKYIFLTHRDDIADAEKYAQQFKSKRIIHEADSSAEPNAEFIINGCDSKVIDDEFIIIPVPGHTKGHCVLYYNKFLFTGDHIYYKWSLARLNAFRNACWYSWEKQTESMGKLLNYQIEWILPGHGQRTKMNVDEIHSGIIKLIDIMKNS